MSDNTISPILQQTIKTNSSQVTNNDKTQENKTDNANKDKKTSYMAIAAGVAAIAIGGLLYLKSNGKSKLPPVKPDIPNINPDVNNFKIKNIQSFFSEKLKSIFSKDIKCGNFDKIADCEVLKNGSKRITHCFTDKDGVQHTVKFVVDKDNNFVHIFDKSIDNTIDPNFNIARNASSLTKYDKDGIIISSTSNHKSEYWEHKYYTFNHKTYFKRTELEKGMPISQTLEEGIIKKTKLKDWQIISDMEGKSVKISTDYTGEKPVKKMEFLTSDKKDQVIVFNAKLDESLPTTPITIYKVDSDGTVIEEIQKEISTIWQQDASFVDVNKIYDVKPWENLLALTEEGITEYKNCQIEPDFYKYLKKNAQITIDDDWQKLFDNIQNREIDIPERFAIMVQNTNAKKGNAYICDKVPKLFEGIEERKIEKTIDALLNEYTVSKGIIKEFVIDGKKFRCKPIGGGIIGKVFKIEDIEGNAVVIKKFQDPTLVSCQGVFSEIPVLRQLSMDKVKDVPEFYMANPMAKFATIDGAEGVTHGGWMMSEYIEKDTPIRKEGIGLIEWLKQHNLVHGDLNNGTYIGDYVVDVGGIYRPKDQFNKHFGALTTSTISSCNKYNYTIPDIVKFMEK